MNWADVLGPAAILPLLAASVRLAIPIVLAAAGESFCQRTGVINLGLEGIMLGGALCAFWVQFETGSPIAGPIAGVLAGLALGVLVAFLVIELRLDQIIVGIAVVLLVGGFTSFVYLEWFGVTAGPPRISTATPLEIPLLSSLPGVGLVLFRQSIFVYLGLILAVGSWVVLTRTRLGLSARAVGERPDAADAAGVSVRRTRWIGVLVSSGLTGLAGAVLVGQLGLFQNQITAGRGWVAVAIVVLARWNPLGAIAGGLLFGFVDALQLRVQAAGGGVETSVPYEFFQALPYAMTLVVVVLAAVWFRRDAEPKALGVPYSPTP